MLFHPPGSVAGWPSAALPDDQLGFEQGHPGGPVVLAIAPSPCVGDGSDDDVHREGPGVTERLMDRGQGWPEVRALGDVVHPDDRELVWDAQAEPVSGVHRAERHLVVAGEDRVDVGCLGSRRRSPSSPLEAVQSPSTTSACGSLRPTARSASRAPTIRSRASHQSSGPVMTATRSAPPARMWPVASRPMARLSMPIDGGTSCRSCRPRRPVARAGVARRRAAMIDCRPPRGWPR